MPDPEWTGMPVIQAAVGWRSARPHDYGFVPLRRDAVLGWAIAGARPA